MECIRVENPPSVVSRYFVLLFSDWRDYTFQMQKPLKSETSVVASDGTVLTTYALRHQSDVERLTERVEAVEETTDILTMEALIGGETV